jgi:hypothetical protein
MLPLRRILAGGGMQIQLIPTVRVAYTFPGGCWRPFWGFPNWTLNIYYETFHPLMSVGNYF